MLFISDYPNEKTIKDGMLQRIKAVDSQFEFQERTYLKISLNKSLSKIKIKINDNCVLYNCNFFVHFFFILKLLLKSDALYYHSLHNYLLTIPFRGIVKRKKIFWDVHGAMPEEAKLAGENIRYIVYSYIERLIYKDAYVVVYVTYAMKKHLFLKYGKRKYSEEVIYPILPTNIINDISNNVELDEKPKDKCIVVYSGNTQSWQNIDEMILFIKKNLFHNVLYFILTGEEDKMKSLFEKSGVTDPKVIIKSVPPDQLHIYYQQAHYGFILRDDIIVNNVACPTKLVEYMFYDIIPIVKTEMIGDFKDKGYEYIRMKEFNMKQKIKLTSINTRIIRKMYEQTKQDQHKLNIIS